MNASLKWTNWVSPVFAACCLFCSVDCAPKLLTTKICCDQHDYLNTTKEISRLNSAWYIKYTNLFWGNEQRLSLWKSRSCNWCIKKTKKKTHCHGCNQHNTGWYLHTCRALRHVHCLLHLDCIQGNCWKFWFPPTASKTCSVRPRLTRLRLLMIRFHIYWYVFICFLFFALLNACGERLGILCVSQWQSIWIHNIKHFVSLEWHICMQVQLHQDQIVGQVCFESSLRNADYGLHTCVQQDESFASYLQKNNCCF